MPSSRYGLLTIGDGLVSQIPSLLISLAAGILVTKGSNEGRLFRNSGQAAFEFEGTYIVGSVLVSSGILLR
ncbi:MAG: FHIPEP family type III secretion protein [Lachnospira sp.]